MMKKYVLLMTAALLSLSVYGNQQSSQDDDVENITVYGQRSLPDIIKKIEKTRVRFYDELNALNDIPKFEMICSMVKPVGSNIAKRECEPRYMKEAKARVTQQNVAMRGNIDISNNPSNSQITMETKREQIAYQKHIQKLLIENPELQTTFIELQNLVAKYKKRVEQKD
jgi:hypothetical protein